MTATSSFDTRERAPLSDHLFDDRIDDAFATPGSTVAEHIIQVVQQCVGITTDTGQELGGSI